MSIFAGKKAIVIGGSGGIGKSLCRLLADSGASIFVHGSRTSQKFDDLACELQKKSDNINIEKLAIGFDIRNFTSSCSALYPYVSHSDILCVCFGPFIQKPLENTSIEDWQKMALLDYALPGYCISCALPYMKRQKWGRILLFGGTRTFAVQGYKTAAAYGGSKTAVCSLVRSTAMSNAGDGITCNAVLPGFVDTEYINDKERSILMQKSPDGKLLKPCDVARFGMMLLSSPDLNGVLLNVDKGWTPQFNFNLDGAFLHGVDKL